MQAVEKSIFDVVWEISLAMDMAPHVAAAVFEISKDLPFEGRVGFLPVPLATARNLGYDEEDMLSASVSLECGCRYLKALWQHFDGLQEESRIRFTAAAFYAGLRLVRQAMKLAEKELGGLRWTHWKEVEPFFHSRRCFVHSGHKKIFPDVQGLIPFVEAVFQKAMEFKKESLHEEG